MEMKACTHCKQIKSVNHFSRCNQTKDGLQYWCRECHNEQNHSNYSKRADKKHHANAEKIRYYKNKYGLEYTLLRSNNSEDRKSRNILFKCLVCGKEVKCSLNVATKNKFRCVDCLKNVEPKKQLSKRKTNGNTSTLVKPSKNDVTYNYKVKKGKLHKNYNCECENNECTCTDHDLQNQVEELNKDLTSDDIIRKIETVRSRIRNGQTPILLVIESTSNNTTTEQPKKKGFWNWLKSLFSHKS